MPSNSDFPGDNETFRADKVKEAAGVSYPQLNEWEQRGLLPEGRTDTANWRKFSPKAVFILAVCSELTQSSSTCHWTRCVG